MSLYRFSGDDERSMHVRIEQQVAAGETERAALQRAAADAIGCTMLDLRDVEIEWIGRAIDSVFAQRQLAGYQSPPSPATRAVAGAARHRSMCVDDEGKVECVCGLDDELERAAEIRQGSHDGRS